MHQAVSNHPYRRGILSPRPWRERAGHHTVLDAAHRAEQPVEQQEKEGLDAPPGPVARTGCPESPRSCTAGEVAAKITPTWPPQAFPTQSTGSLIPRTSSTVAAAAAHSYIVQRRPGSALAP
jgi:hypothetical protein